ncbi:tyrosine-protein phosphatase [Novosphingobium mangrovi (ex Huang et al. 2023)]|uniref:Tyrosine-protein phosphatase n=1 Tax=Novosphingobium mangrovi (ex Huang et al. 2023) TaxID=2976432 RepID=A0ABT2IA26_9SPHN|nr:tyrosine-protein phosphatase [Novosphingobium mangrovi (ex Huang et al. 2023)]MCT2401679.1 tyrosine-protein phosphatase [Novosphingobium mangrovi (ex Huang et al. 2023)]
MDEDLARRLQPLEGGINFRDMGGYPAMDGHRVKWGRLYRSGTMSRLTPADHAYLAGLGIRCVVDFRSRRERAREPNRWCAAAGIDYWSRDHQEVFGQLHTMAKQGIGSEEQAMAIMAEGFRHLPFQQAPAYAELVRRIADGHVPIAFNCTAGKDRTGGAAALVLAILGTPRDTIVADFTLTEQAVDLRKAFGARPEDPSSPYAGLSEPVMNALAGARPGYIAAFLDAIDERCGSIEGYLAEIGVPSGAAEAMRAHLLEPG